MNLPEAICKSNFTIDHQKSENVDQYHSRIVSQNGELTYSDTSSSLEEPLHKAFAWDGGRDTFAGLADLYILTTALEFESIFTSEHMRLNLAQVYNIAQSKTVTHKQLNILTLVGTISGSNPGS